MMERMEYVWRVLATGVCFVVFGLGGLLMTVTAFPVIFLVSRGEKQRRQRVQGLISLSFRLFTWLMTTLKTFTLEVEGYEKVRGRENLLVIANHPSLIDVILVISHFPCISCVVKEDLWINPFLWGVVRSAGYIANSDPESVLKQSVAFIEQGGSIVVFPEGGRTRIPPKELQRGAANIAIRSGTNLTPVIITCEPPMLTKYQRWYQLPRKRSHYRVSFQEDIGVAHFAKEADNYALASRRLTQYIEQYFKAGITK